MENGRAARSQPMLSRKDVGNQARMLVASFVHDRMEADGLTPVDETDMYEPGLAVDAAQMSRERFKEVGGYLRLIGDELDRNEKLQVMIANLGPDSTNSTFVSVAKQLFADGNFNWGRVVTLFYFAYHMVRKALGDVNIIRTVIKWTVDFIIEFVAEWIIGRGGWGSVGEYFAGATGKQMAGIAAACAATCLIVWYWR